MGFNDSTRFNQPKAELKLDKLDLIRNWDSASTKPQSRISAKEANEGEFKNDGMHGSKQPWCGGSLPV